MLDIRLFKEDELKKILSKELGKSINEIKWITSQDNNCMLGALVTYYKEEKE
ncbi:hypothetical protein [Aerococcus sp. Group 1]|uniref:hypothetical protein n=1 Tax=Aerococcus urinae (strain CCUG 59500 / ACS-120-V-Col10a) TaxID=2976812 RepID=UPI00227C7472|nr:hypothetical protein [Aerococcus sp. Group 1]MCY3031368.1 hypothetical protein [Aerococcus sp. Group 1]